MQSVYPRAFVCLLCWKPILGDPRSLHLCAGKVAKTFYVSTRSCEPLSRSSTQYTLWRSKSYKFMVLWTWTFPGSGDVETELWEGVRQGRATDSEAMTRVHKVKWLNTCDFHLQAKWRKLHLGRHTLSIIPPVIQTGKQKPNSPRLLLYYRLSPCPLSEQAITKAPYTGVISNYPLYFKSLPFFFFLPSFPPFMRQALM